MSEVPRLSRGLLAARGAPAEVAPVRIVHLGLGAFHRAHQAWYTALADDGGQWGIAAFTGRSADIADRLRPQQGVYTLVERGRDGDRMQALTGISHVHTADDHAAWARLLAAPTTSVVTLTVTEAGYASRLGGGLDRANPQVASDLSRVRIDGIAARPVTPVGRLVVGLEHRRRRGSGPLAIVPCDNLPGNGEVLRSAVTEFAAQALPDLARALPETASFVSTSVDRITPAVTDRLGAEVREAMGWWDAAPVATEPFSDWTLCGRFPAGRPCWESAGALFVDDIEPYELRKLWLLNGAHSMLACLGLLRGHATIADAMDDRVCAEAIRAWWADAVRHLDPALHADHYCSALVERFHNPRIEHRLGQISRDGLAKLTVRIAPVAVRERRAGRAAGGGAQAVGCWIAAAGERLLGEDARGGGVQRALSAADPVRAMVAALDASLAADDGFVGAVRGWVRRRGAAEI